MMDLMAFPRERKLETDSFLFSMWRFILITIGGIWSILKNEPYRMSSIADVPSYKLQGAERSIDRIPITSYTILPLFYRSVLC